MKSGFKEPNAIKNQKPKDKPIEGKNSPWDFRCPQYDERDSCYVKAGTQYGVGITQPVGSSNAPKQRVDALPFGKVNTMKLYED